MKKFLTISILSLLFLSACKKDNDAIIPAATGSGKTTLTFDAVFGSSDFALNKDFSIGTQTFNFNKFRYWVSNVVLVKANGEEYKVPSSYFLIEETAAVAIQDGAFTYPATKREDVLLSNIPAGDYKSIKFSVGVDAKYNDNLSLQSGELSQLNGMTNVSWMWMTSYIFSSIGGKVTQGTDVKTLKIETGLNANYKTVALDLPQSIRIDATKDVSITLKTDVSKALDGIDVISTPSVGAAQATVMASVANNYGTKVFTVQSVK